MIEIIAKYLSGEANETEIQALKQWIGESDANRQRYFQLKNIWDLHDKSVDPEMIDVEQALIKIKSGMKIRGRIARLWYWWQRIAAILIIPLAAGAVYHTVVKPEKTQTAKEEVVYNVVRSAYGNRTEVTLSDGSVVMLDSKSSLIYPEKFIGGTREVNLEGQAYFQVKSDVRNPFVVNTSRLQISATGTTFDISDYSSKPESQVTLVSGKVAVSKILGENVKEHLPDLEPDQSLTYNSTTGDIKLEEGLATDRVAWKDGLLVFRNEPMSKVIEKLSEVFEVNIELRDKSLENYRYRATFQDETLSEILKLLKVSSPVDYIELKRDPLPDGTFEPRKIIIFGAHRQTI